MSKRGSIDMAVNEMNNIMIAHFMGADRFYYTGNEEGNYSIFDRERDNSQLILTAHMGEDCVLQLIHILNNSQLQTEQ